MEQSAFYQLKDSPEDMETYYQISKRGTGFTPEERRHVWLQASGAQKLLDFSLEHSHTSYDGLIDNYDREFPTSNRHQIAVDMPRTFPDESFFRTNKDPKREPTLEEELGAEVLETVQRICTAYSVRNAHVGYSQGFNFIVARLLQTMTEEEAFWTFTCIVENMMPIEYFQQMSGARVDQQIMEHLIWDLLPELANHFENIGY